MKSRYVQIESMINTVKIMPKYFKNIYLLVGILSSTIFSKEKHVEKSHNLKVHLLYGLFEIEFKLKLKEILVVVQ